MISSSFRHALCILFCFLVFLRFIYLLFLYFFFALLDSLEPIKLKTNLPAFSLKNHHKNTRKKSCITMPALRTWLNKIQLNKLKKTEQKKVQENEGKKKKWGGKKLYKTVWESINSIALMRALSTTCTWTSLCRFVFNWIYDLFWCFYDYWTIYTT